MKFLTNWTIDLTKVPKYSEFNTRFQEHVDYKLANLILESKDERLTPEIKAEFKKMVDCINPKTNILEVKYSSRRGGVGRRYPDCPEVPNGEIYSALIAQPRLIKNTIFKYQKWVDIDQVKGHPTMLMCVAEKNGLDISSYFNILNPERFDELVKDFSDYYSVPGEIPLDKKDVKQLFNRTIYGGGHKGWVAEVQSGKFKNHDGKVMCMRVPKQMRNQDKPHALYTAFYADTQKIIEKVYYNNDELVAAVCTEPEIQGDDNLWKRKNRVMSYFCGTIENEITYVAYKFLVKQGAIQKRLCDWGLDGITMPQTQVSIDDVMDKLNEHVRKTTGLSRVSFVRKDFDDNEILHDCIKERMEMPEEVEEDEPAEMDNEIDDKPHPSFEEMAAEFEMTHCKIINKAVFIKQLDETNIMMSKAQIKTAYEHLVYFERHERTNKKTEETIVTYKEHNFIDKWLRNNGTIKTFDDVGLYPDENKRPENHFNLWRPFAMEFVTEYTHHTEGLDFMLNHLKIMCNHDEACYSYFIKWIAQMIQYPDVKTICPTFISKQGGGKTSVVRLLSCMLGDAKVLETTCPSRDVWGNFNSLMADAYFVVLNELSKSEMMKAEEHFKALVTEPNININNKGVSVVKIASHHRFMITTNNDEARGSTADDRRNFIIRCSDELCKNKEYFAKFYAYLNDVNVVKTCYEYFKSIEGVDKFHDLEIPRTEHQKNLNELSENPIVSWLKAYTLKNFDQMVPIELTGAETLMSFRAWCLDNGVNYEINSTQLGVRLSNLKIPGISKGRHTKNGATKYYNIGELKTHFGLDCVVLDDAKPQAPAVQPKSQVHKNVIQHVGDTDTETESTHEDDDDEDL